MYQPELGSESIDLRTGAVPDDRMGRCMEEILMRGRRRVYQGGISDGQRTGVTEAGFCIATEDRPRKGER